MRNSGTKIRAALVVLSFSAIGIAQTDAERAGARATAMQGVEAFGKGQWTEAADLMRRAEKLVHSLTHLLYLAKAEEQLGHFVSAQETYVKIVREKLKADAPDAFRTSQVEAQKRLDTLAPRVPQVTITVKGNADTQPVAVTMDGASLAEALVGVRFPVDPGTHRFEATAAGLKSNIAEIQSLEGAADQVVLTLAVAASSAPAAATSTPAVPAEQNSGTASGGSLSSVSSSPGVKPLRIGAYVGMGLGVVGLGVGTAYAFIAAGKRSDADNACNPNASGACQGNKTQVESIESDARSAEKIRNIGFIAGGVCLAAGFTMFLLSPSRQEPSKSAWVQPYIGPSSIGAFGRF